MLDHVRQCAGEHREVTSELRLASKSGQAITAQLHSIPIEGPAEETLCKTAITDITERKRTEEALRDSENELRLIMDSVPTLIAFVDSDCRYRRVNETYERWFGLAREEIEGRHIGEVLGEAAWKAIQPHAERALTGEIVTFEEELPLRGGPRWLHATYTPERDESGRVCGFVVHSADIGERRRMEEALREGQQRFQTVADFTYAWEDWRAADGQFLYCSPACDRITGYSRDEFLQDPSLFDRIIHPDDRARVEAHHGEAHACPTECELEFRIVRRDGQERWIGHVCQPVIDVPQGRPQGRRASNRDITERKQAEQTLQQAKADAERANHAKSRLLAYVSHDLRTPTSAVLGMVDLALLRTTEPTAKDFLQTAKDSADLLLALLNDLLDSARIESGKLIELDAAPFSLRRVLEQTTRVLTVRASQKGISFSCCIPPEVPDWLVGDRVRLRQILLNLAGNGIKFTEQGEVAVSVRVESQSVEEACLEFAVRDTGIGIPPADMERIFQPFAQANPSTSRRSEGTGLGLTISASLAAAMGGRIWVESEPEQGSTFHFTVRLPLAKERPAQPEAGSEVFAPAMSILRVLLVEDNPANQKLAAFILKERGHTVEIAGSGRRALRMAQETHYDVILMDVEMPGMDGLETTAAIRARENGEGRVPIIAMTAHAMKGDRQRCLEAGMDGYLSKPVDGRVMIALVESLAAGKTIPGEAGETAAPAAGEATASSAPEEAADASVFDLQEAMKCCCGREEAFQTMVGNFFKDVESLLPEMRSALQNGDVVTVGELGHRLKGTVVYLARNGLRTQRFAWNSLPARAVN